VIPYFEVRQFQMGQVTVPSFLVLLVTAIAVASIIIVVRGHRQGVAYERTVELCLWAALAGYVGGHLFRFMYVPDEFIRMIHDPRRIMAGGIASFGGFFGGIAGAYGFFLWRKIRAEQRLKFLDLAAFALPFSWVFGRVGCALVHDHPGLRTNSWLGVRFPGGTRYDLGLLEVFFLLALGALFLILDRKERPTGFYFGLYFFLYGIFRIVLDQLHVDPPRYLGVTVDQYAGLAAIIIGALSLSVLVRKGRVTRYTEALGGRA
jgi:phosphatidylglycerol:prolipoprotein diacylglycerol transferase